MGTNYYAEDVSSTFKQRYHIGKSSGGWEFSFHSPNQQIISWEDWKRYLRLMKIVDEYDREVSFEEFVRIVEYRGDDPLNSYNEMEGAGYSTTGMWKDESGYSFCRREFS